MNWYKIELTKEEVANFKHTKILTRFDILSLEAGRPKGFTLFQPLEDSQGQIYYLPPNAREFCNEILEEYSAKECDAPNFETLKVASGTGADLTFWKNEN